MSEGLTDERKFFQRTMDLNPNLAFFSGKEAVQMGMKDPELRRKIYGEGSYYYTICGTVINIIQSQMVDIKDMLVARKLFRFDIKKAFSLSLTEIDNLLQGMKTGIYEYNGEFPKEKQDMAYRFWLDATDSATEALQTKVDRVEKMMMAYVKKSIPGEADLDLITKVCLISTLVLYVRDKLYKEIMEVTEHVSGLDLRSVFLDGDCKRVYRQWEFLEKKLVWPWFKLDFSDSPSVVRAFDSFVNLLQNYRLYKKAVRYSRSFLSMEERDKQARYQQQRRKWEKEHIANKLEQHDLSRSV